MKKRLNIILAGILLTAAVMLAGGFCIQDISGEIESINSSHAKHYSKKSTQISKVSNEVCNVASNTFDGVGLSSGYGVKQANALVRFMAAAHPEQNRTSSLPCCEEDSRLTLVSASQSFELGKQVLLPTSLLVKISPSTYFISLYTAPKISSPELLAIKKTVLRI